MKKVTEEFAKNNPPAFKLEYDYSCKEWVIRKWEEPWYEGGTGHWHRVQSYVFKWIAMIKLKKLLNPKPEPQIVEYYVK